MAERQLHVMKTLTSSPEVIRIMWEIIPMTFLFLMLFIPLKFYMISNNKNRAQLTSILFEKPDYIFRL
jgi:hypothetical protein